ncbi:MAG: redoxin domain-containing protein [Flavobacteriaceae bacterium]|nr:redoxin domain-containing protein [Flavobacteriaceae bacterium]
MRYIIALFIIFLYSCSNSSYTLNGSVDLEDGTEVYLVGLDNNNQPKPVDTLIVNAGVFTYESERDIPEMHYIFFEGLRDVLPVVLEPGNISVEAYKDSIRTSRVRGTTSNEDFSKYRKESIYYIDELMGIQNEMRNAMIAKDSLQLTDLQEQFSDMRKDLQRFEVSFIAENPKSYISVLILEQLLSSEAISEDEGKELFEDLSSSVKATKSAKNISDLLYPEAENNNAADQPAPAVGTLASDFEAPNPTGGLVSLKDVKSKLTVIDFWASWCKPCRMQSDRLVDMHNQFKDNGLSMVSVSLDRDADSWKAAIEADNLNWTHVSNLKYWNEPIARDYSVNAIPELFLLDENGVVIYRGRDVNELSDEIIKSLNQS